MPYLFMEVSYYLYSFLVVMCYYMYVQDHLLCKKHEE